MAFQYPFSFGLLDKAKVNRRCANTRFRILNDHCEPVVVVPMPVIKNSAPQTQSHTRRQEGVIIELSDPILSILPPIFWLVVLETKPFQSILQSCSARKKEQNMELHFLQGSNQDCFMIESCWKYSSVIQTQILACSFLLHCMLSDMNYRIRLSGYDCRLNNSHPSFTCLFKMSYFGSF